MVILKENVNLGQLVMIPNGFFMKTSFCSLKSLDTIESFDTLESLGTLRIQSADCTDTRSVQSVARHASTRSSDVVKSETAVASALAFLIVVRSCGATWTGVAAGILLVENLIGAGASA